MAAEWKHLRTVGIEVAITAQLIFDNFITVQRTQPGPHNIDQPITGHVYNKGVWLW